MGKKKQQRGRGKAKKYERCKNPILNELALSQSKSISTDKIGEELAKAHNESAGERDKLEELRRQKYCLNTGAIEEGTDSSAKDIKDMIELHLPENERIDYINRRQKYEEVLCLPKIYLNARVRYVEQKLSTNNETTGEWCEGIVKSIVFDEENACHRYSILPVEADDTEEIIVMKHSLGEDVKIIDEPWFKKFHDGDLVIARSNKNTWHLARVKQRKYDLWIKPPWYGLECLHRPNSQKELLKYSERYGEITAFKQTRFSVGQKVTYCEIGSLAIWRKGTIDQCNNFESRDFPAVYRVRDLERSSPAGVLIPVDTDRYIADIDSTPRKRFMDAIEQQCSYAHLSKLVETSNLDVSSFEDLVIDMAIEKGSYDGLWWMQKELKFDLRNIQDEKGGGLLHRIAMSPHANFFEMAFDMTEGVTAEEYHRYLDLGSPYSDDSLLSSVDNDGRSWLHELVLSGNYRALELACSPCSILGMNVLRMLFNKGKSKGANSENNASSFQHFAHVGSRDKHGNTLRDLAMSLKEFKLAKMIDEHAEQATLMYVAMRFQDYQYDESNLITSFLRGFRNEMPGRILSRIIKFARRYMEIDIYGALAKLPGRLVQAGDIDTLKWLVEAMPVVSGAIPICHALYQLDSTLENMDEFTQPELFVSTSLKPQHENTSLVAHCVHGLSDAKHAFHTSVTKGDIQAYYALFDRMSFVDESLEADLDAEKASKGISTGFSNLLEFKVALLRDPKDLKRRLQMLEYLVDERNLTPPNAVDTIRFRQCAMLIWLVQRSFVKLGDLAALNRNFDGYSKKFRFLGGKKMPARMFVGQFLCFLAIEYDDLQSLRWLLLEQQMDPNVDCNGWNLIHTCAHFGRIEIFLWLLSTIQDIRHLVRSPIRRKNQVGLYAVHLALRRGFRYLAERLLKAGCPDVDEQQRPLVWHTKSSCHVFVRRWGERNKASSLVDDLSAVLALIDSGSKKHINKTKRLISTSRCLDPKRWLKESPFFLWDEPGPSGIKYADVILQCCEKGQPDFICWLFDHIWQEWITYDANKPCFHNTKGCNGVTLKEMGMLNPGDSLWKFVDIRWAKKIQVEDPVLANGMLHFMQTKGGKIAKSIGELRKRTIQQELLLKLLKKTNYKIRDMISIGVAAFDITEIAIAMESLIETMHDEFDESSTTSYESFVISKDGKLNLKAISTGKNKLKTHPAFRQRLGLILDVMTARSVYMTMVTEGYAHLVDWSLSPDWNTWDAERETHAIRTASFCGHSHIVDLFLTDDQKIVYKSARSSRFCAACLGAVESSRMSDLAAIISKSWDASEIATLLRYREVMVAKKGSKLFATGGLIDSFLGSTLFGCLENAKDDEFLVLHWVLDKFEVAPERILRTMIEEPNCVYGCKAMTRFIALFRYLVCKRKLNIWCCQSEIAELSSKYLAFVDCGCDNNYSTQSRIFLDWVRCLVSIGYDIQSLRLVIQSPGSSKNKNWNNLRASLRDLKANQRKSWSKFDVLKKGAPLSSVQSSFLNETLDTKSRDAKGMLPTHIAASYDRQDVLSWLVDSLGASLLEIDGRGRTVLEVADQCNAVSTYRWVKRRRSETQLKSFLTCNYLRRRAMREKSLKLNSLRRLQAIYRGFKARCLYQETLKYKVDLSRKFHFIWKSTLDIFDRSESDNHLSWITLKHDSFDMQPEIDDMWQETSGKLAAVVFEVLQEAQDEDEDHQQVAEAEPTMPYGGATTHQAHHVRAPSTSLSSVKLTKYAWKWVENSDPAYRRFFIAKIQRLATGDRSRTLSKRLKGTNKAVFETYLEQKSGHRILWTNEPAIGLIIWYVAPHDRVSRLALLIDQADQRTGRQLSSASEISELQEAVNVGALSDAATSRVVLDPFGNIPLKLYELHQGEISKLHDITWKPQLYLTDEERQVVEQKGTVLVLGRSGTGKTICICNRIDYDRTVAETNDQHISQLFVARSEKLCRYVQGAVGQGSTSSARFTTFGQLLSSLERDTTLGKEMHSRFPPDSHVGLVQFQCIPRSSDSVESLLVWAHIRTFIKGSIAVVQRNRHLTREEYLHLGKKECRLDSSQRHEVYDAYEQYDRYCSDYGLWDDCDRVADALRQLQSLQQINETMFSSVQFDKIYVDEIQDYTQAEIALFFTLAGPGDLFLAGDPAQAVVEGVEFRFESCRSVAFHLYGQENHHLVPDKPKIVNVNFRSHSGILNLAAGVLKHLFNVFPGCAKQLKEDRGLFRGPRPGLMERIDYGVLKDLVRRLHGLVILCHDETVSQLRQNLDGYPFCYGIREAKGLEFETVLIVDFFSTQGGHLQKPWRDLFLDRDTHGMMQTHPELERQLKLLYTAVTRSISKLYFAESGSNVSVEAFRRWIIESQLAVRQRVDNIGAFSRTQDEWHAAGVDHAATAEGSGDPLHAVACLDRAIYCFDQIGDCDLRRKAKTNRESAQFRASLLRTFGSQQQVTQQNNDPSDPTEMTCMQRQASQVLSNLIQEQLLVEARKVCDLILPQLCGDDGYYTRQALQKLLVSKLPSHQSLN